MKPASDRFAFGIPTPTYLRSDRQLPGSETQLGPDRFRDSLPDMTGLGAHDELPGRRKGYDPTRSPEAAFLPPVDFDTGCQSLRRHGLDLAIKHHT